MSDGTTLLFALPGYRVLDVTRDAEGGRVVLVESTQAEGGCPAWGGAVLAGQGATHLPGQGPAARAGAAAGVGA